MTERLTSLSAVKVWLGIEGDEADDLLRHLIEGASQFVLNYIGRETFTARVYTDRFLGNGKGSAVLKNWPVISITSVFVAGATINASNFGSYGLPSSGYSLGEVLEGPGSLDLVGYMFYSGAPAEVVYTAGYQTSQSFTTTETDSTVDPIFTTLRGQWIANVRVLSGDTVLTEVVGTPSTGEYAVNEDGVYTFADAAIPVTITYNYAPMDISMATMELVGEAYRRKERIGQISKTMGGQQTAAYSQKDMNDTIRSALNPYRRVVPV